MKIILFIYLTLNSLFSVASTCIADEQPSEFTIKHRDSIKFDFGTHKDEIDVQITAPKVIEGLSFYSATLYKGDIKALDFDFIFSLKEKYSGDKVNIFYMVVRPLLEENTIELVYGGSCGKGIQLKVPDPT